MSIMTVGTVLLGGLLIGMVGGMLGIGGGILVIPLLMSCYGFSQAKANGTSLAMLLPPIGIFAVISYWKAGNIDFRVAMLLAAGFAAGAFLGGHIVNSGRINPTVLRVLFALLLLFVASRLLFRSGGRARAALETLFLLTVFVGSYAALRLLGRSWERPPRDWGAVYRHKVHEPVEYDYEI